jgi:hypothetical protein
MNTSEIKPALKIVLWPIIFVAWAVYRLTHVTYVDSPAFTEYWEKL